MTRSSRWNFRKSSQPAVEDIFTGIFQLIQLRNLGTKYWVYGVARKLGFGENSVWSSTPRLGEGLSNMLEGWMEGARSPNRGRKAPENRRRSLRLSTGRGLGRGSVSPSPEKFCKFILETMHFGVWLKRKSKFSPSGSRNFPEIFQHFDTFQSNAYYGVEESPFSKTCTWWSK